LLDQTTPDINFDDWADMTPKQQLNAAQKSGLSAENQWTLLNATPHYVETIAKVQDLYATRYALSLTVSDTKNLAKELFAIADERDEAISRTDKYANDAVFAPKALRWLEEQEEKLLSKLEEDTNDTGQETLYNGSNPDLAATPGESTIH
jgi:hypothetical protein